MVLDEMSFGLAKDYLESPAYTQSLAGHSQENQERFMHRVKQQTSPYDIPDYAGIGGGQRTENVQVAYAPGGQRNTGLSAPT